MALREQYPAFAPDPLLQQAETVFSQRQARHLMIDAELLGEPGWDILLCAYIAHRKGERCSLETFTSKIRLSPEITKRWVYLLAARDMLDLNGQTCAISLLAESKLTTLFAKQSKQILQSAGSRAARKRSSAPDLD